MGRRKKSQKGKNRSNPNTPTSSSTPTVSTTPTDLSTAAPILDTLTPKALITNENNVNNKSNGNLGDDSFKTPARPDASLTNTAENKGGETVYKTPEMSTVTVRTKNKTTANSNISSVGISAKSTSFAAGRAKAVDLVTGRAVSEYFFDPSLILDENTKTGSGPIGSATPFRTPRRQKSSDLDNNGSDSIIFSSKHLYYPCTIVKSLETTSNGNNIDSGSTAMPGPALVKTSDGTLYKVSDAQGLLPLTSPDDYEGMDDVLHLANVSEASLLHTLRTRYRRDEIYTNAGPILISVNPYRPITVGNGESLYSEKMMMKYRTSESFSNEAPHLFQVADRAYSAMMDSVHAVPRLEDEDPSRVIESPRKFGLSPGQVVNQSIIISGESGAGKTEATKYIMQYLARITKKKGKWTSDNIAPVPFMSPDGKVLAALEDRVLSSNPLLETFGNAQTLRNDNSSRFGKFIHINFSTEKGIIIGARISNYLLEKTRITTQIEGERNYHIFYQLFSGASQDQLKQLGLESGTKAFRYLGYRSFVKNSKDEAAFFKTMQCLRNVGLATDEHHALLGVAAAVLHIGNISFEEKDDDDEHVAVITEASRPSLSKACELLGLKEDDVTEAFLTKLLTIGGKSIKKPSTVAMAEDKRDALAKMTYSSLFLWLVSSINRTLSQQKVDSRCDTKKTGFIGVLDIYGFECFESNGYEQLLINYCNEKLQRHFNRHLFEVEQNLYSSEGVDWTYITFNDNQPCLELIEGGNRVVGILNTLDDSYAGMGSASEKDVKFVAQLHKLFGSVAGAKKTNGGHDYFVTPKFGSDRQFIISHYAGEVRYTADGFVEKNMESLSNELKDLGSTSSIQFAKEVFECGPSADDQQATRRSSIRGFSVAAQFKLSLQSLVDDLELTQPHYIRCIKPNLNKASSSFASGEVLKQLRYSGMMEAIRIRREGYALREEHQSFFNRFSVLLGSDEIEGNVGIEQLVTVLSRRLNVTDADWQIGHTKIFLRRELSDKLERLARLRVHRAARTVGRFGRNIARRRAAVFIAAWMRFRVVMMRLRRTNRAAEKIVASVRMYVQIKRFRAALSAAIKIQSQQRRVMAIRVVQKMRDPYCNMSYTELKTLLEIEKSRLEDVIGSKDFQAAAIIESEITAIKIAIDAKQPMTRSRLEEKLSLAQKNLDDAIERKAYKEAGPLQDEVEKLSALRVEYPTLDELKSSLARAEEAVSDAAKNRDFASAASLQSEVDNARKRLEDALGEESVDESSHIVSERSNKKPTVDSSDSVCGVESRAHLEEQLAALHGRIEIAIATKDFKTASSLQAKVEEKERLRVHFPSLEELESKLKVSRDKLDSSILQKDFKTAGELHEEIDGLEKKIESERAKSVPSPMNVSESDDASVINTDGKKVTFSSRFDLDQAIVVEKEKQSKEVAAKNFKKAQEIQHFIEKMEALRKKLPTTVELRQKISRRKEEMQAAVAEKRFVDAERIDQDILGLEERLKMEEKNQSAKPTAPMPKRLPVSVPLMSKTNSSDVSVRSAPILKKTLSPIVVGGGANTVVGGESMLSKSVVPPPGLVSQSRRPRDDISDVTSVYSSRSNRKKKTNAGKLTSLVSHSEEGRPVSKLRPKKPLIANETDSVLSVSKLMATKRASSSLIVDKDGCLAGIVTDTDITRRLVAKELNSSSTQVSDIATLNPSHCSMQDSAMGALTTMVSNGFRHLPVTDENGHCVGLLDISKVINDAISKLENAESRNASKVQEALMEVVASQGGQSSSAALQSLLTPLMEQAFGSKSSPTVRSLLTGKPSTIVTPDSTILEAAMKMADTKKAALIVEDGQLVGVFSFKDVLNRCVAKELPLSTDISSVMTPAPMTISPEESLLEALQIMHSEGFLTLPVVEKDGAVVGVINILDVIYGAGGADGWRSLFSSALDMDDFSDDASARSGIGGSVVGSTSGGFKPKQPSVKKEDVRPVSKLRPKKPLVSSVNDTVLAVTQMLAKKRGSATLVVNDVGGLAGIVTDTDITRRLVVKELNASSTPVLDIATLNPSHCSMDDSAMDALTTMVSNGFRHLPVTDEHGQCVGLLDIARVLTDAIKKLEKTESKSADAAQDALMEVVTSQGGDTQAAAALHAVLGPLMAKAFGDRTSPSLGTLLKGSSSTTVSPEATVFEAGQKMAANKKPALIVEEGRLVGIFGFKDMMNRVVSKELSLDTEVSSVMTADPECVSPDMSALEALETMHSGKFLSLPVVANDHAVLGVVTVMDVIAACGGAEGWRSIFSSTLDMDELSETSSVHSGFFGAGVDEETFRESRSHPPQEEKTVAKLRPRKPIFSNVDDTIFEVSKRLATQRADATVIVDKEGIMTGIVTDTDFTRRVVAKGVDPSTAISDVMTQNPESVKQTEPGIEAIATMIENHFRHLPVLGSGDTVVGLLDVARCLNDAISKLERSISSKPNSAEVLVQQALQASGSAEAAALHALLKPLLSKANAGTDAGTRTLGSLLSSVPKTIVAPDATVRLAAGLMSENRKAALVVEDGELVGLFGFKDLMSRVLAKGLDPNGTIVADVMTADPETVGPEMTALDALRFMHDNRFLTLPCCDDTGSVVGLVDVMDVVYAIGGAEQWRALFDAALQMDDASDNHSATKSMTPSRKGFPGARINSQIPPALPSNIPSTLEFQEGMTEEFDENTLNDTTFRMETGSFLSDGNITVFKIVDKQGHTHRVRSEPKMLNLRNAVAEKLNKGRKNHTMTFKYKDDEGDEVLVTTDEDLVEAVAIARSSNQSQGGKLVVKLVIEESKTGSAAGLHDPLFVTGIGITLAAVAVGAMMLIKPGRH